MTTPWTSRLALLLCVPAFVACTDDALDGGLGEDESETSTTEDPSGPEETETGDGDGDDPTGDGDGDDPATGDGDGDGDDSTSGDGDGDEPMGDCPAINFPELSADPANGDYPDPFVDAYCEGDEVVVEANGIPAYEFVQVTPNALQAQDYEWRFPRYPEVANQTSEIPLLGVTGVAVNGMPLFGPNEAMFPDPYGDPVYNGIVDFCLGHTAMMGVYHYHALLVECMTAADVLGQPSPVIAYSLDGFPIYGPQGCADAECSEVVEYGSGWVQTGDPSTYAWDNHEYQDSPDPAVLDACNGHLGPQGDYHYHATPTFPYILGCYAGTATPAGMGGGMP